VSVIDRLCRGVRPHFSAHLDAVPLPLHVATAVRLHLAFCPMCRRTWRSLQETRAVLAELRDADVKGPLSEE
jgi:predicted anti-sigma-YlaC factor YlaD